MGDANGAEERAGLEQFLAAAVTAHAALEPVAATVRAIAAGAVAVADQIALGPLSVHAKPASGTRNTDGDVQQALDLLTNTIFMDALASAPVAVAVSEELHEPLEMRAGAPLVVAIDPLDGSSNISANVSIGTIFSVLPAVQGASGAAHFYQPGRNQLAAGFVVYGPQTILVLSIGGPTASFILDRGAGAFVTINDGLAIPPDSHEYAINASNYRHWDPAVQAFVEEKLAVARLQHLPGRERAGRRVVELRLREVVHVVARLAGAVQRVVLKRALQTVEQVGVRAEMAEVGIAGLRLARHGRAHVLAIKAVKGVTLDVDGLHRLAPEDLLERPADGGRPRAGGSGDGDDGVGGRHACSPPLGQPIIRPRELNSCDWLFESLGSV